jgi:hypothetical protein
MVPVRLFQALRLIAFGSTMEKMLGSGAKALVYQSGQQLGEALGGAVRSRNRTDLDQYLDEVEALCRRLSIGVFVPERIELDDGFLALRVDECVSCAGIHGANAPICHFEAGLVGGIVRCFFDTDVKASEVKCNAVGDKSCMIHVRSLHANLADSINGHSLK